MGLLAALLATPSLRAASLTKVNNWGASGVPATASMYIYVPDKVATKPPIVVVAHYCGGTASAVFGQASGIQKAADQYGFIMVVPQTTNNCWDVGSTKALTHDGGGDTQAVAQMVKYAITTYSANADRVYVTGDSSGGMMTQGLLAVYPEVFKGGAAFAGVPAGCWAVGDPDGSWSSQCAGGSVTHTAQEWGDLVRKMYPSYTGHRPRVQLVHGDADPTINYKNHTEAIKEWTNVLGLSTEPTSTDTVTLGSHQATRQQWKNACGYVVLDAYQSKGGDHGPSDAIFNAAIVVPFFGLDKTDATDPEIAMCGMGGGGGMGGAGGMAAMGGRGGANTGGMTGSGGQSGGSGGAGGVAMGGMPGVSGNPSSGGVSNAGGALGSAGKASSGGSAGAMSAAGGSGATSGSGNAGTSALGGSSTGMAGGSSAGRGASAGGSAGVTSGSGSPADQGGCGCIVGGNAHAGGRALSLALVALLALRRRRLRPS
jgi:acetylxylan esterase